jgi:hypothetical protein
VEKRHGAHVTNRIPVRSAGISLGEGKAHPQDAQGRRKEVRDRACGV